VVEVRREDVRTRFSLVSTHHGFEVEAALDGDLERIIQEIRVRHPELAVD
jgi:hypothetical protein